MPLGVAALLLSGCSSEASESAPAAKDAPASSATSSAPTADLPVDGMGPGSYTFETADGVTGTLEVPGAAPVDIEELRTVAGAAAVLYLTGNLDNREGSDPFDVYMINVYDAEGNEYSYLPAQDYIGEITPADAEGEEYNKYSRLYNQYSTVVSAMERKDFVMVGPELPAEISGVSVSNGFEDFGAQPAG